jgi:hypothetical protein
MAALPDGQRISMYLSQVEGWTHAEIGEYLGIAPATVAVHVHRARVALWEEDFRTDGYGGRTKVFQADSLIFREGPLSSGSVTVRSAVWVWCQCWPGEPQRWQAGRAGEADNA